MTTTPALNRGVLDRSQRHVQAAVGDFELALADGADPAAVHFNLALAHRALHDRPSALASVERAIQYRPPATGRRSICAAGYLRSSCRHKDCPMY